MLLLCCRHLLALFVAGLGTELLGLVDLFATGSAFRRPEKRHGAVLPKALEFRLLG
jgi:hypothetical protein